MADYTDDITAGMSYSASSTEFSIPVPFFAGNAFDDNTGTYWSSDSGFSAGEWIKVNFGSGNYKKIEKITIQNNSGYGFNSFKLQGSNNDSDWTDIYSGTATNDETVQTFIFSNSVEYRYYRMYCVSGYSASRIRIIEIEMMEIYYFPLTITLSESLEYGITLSESLEYGITLSESLEYGITLSETGGG